MTDVGIDCGVPSYTLEFTKPFYNSFDVASSPNPVALRISMTDNVEPGTPLSVANPSLTVATVGGGASELVYLGGVLVPDFQPVYVFNLSNPAGSDTVGSYSDNIFTLKSPFVLTDAAGNTASSSTTLTFILGNLWTVAGPSVFLIVSCPQIRHHRM